MEPRLYLRQPLYRSVWAFAASALIGALVSDLAYVRTADFIWADFSDWLVTGGVVIGGLAAVVMLIEVFAVSELYAPPWPYVIACFVAWALAVVDMLIHTRDSWSSVVPWGVSLSALVVLALLVAALIPRWTGAGATAEERAA